MALKDLSDSGSWQMTSPEEPQFAGVIYPHLCSCEYGEAGLVLVGTRSASRKYPIPFD